MSSIISGQSAKIAKTVLKNVKPILSTNHAEARRRALNLYRAWYRQVPHICLMMHIHKNEEQLRAKIREEFMKKSDVTDLRIIDMMIFHGEKRLEEAANLWSQENHVLMDFNETIDPKPTDFLSSFFNSNYKP